MSSRDESVLVLQKLLTVLGSKLSLDGIFGPRTARAFASFNREQRDSIQKLIFAEPQLRVFSLATLTDVANKMFPNATDIQEYIAIVLRHENYIVTNAQGTDVVVSETFGKHKGLAQFNSATWDDLNTGHDWTDIINADVSLLGLGLLYKDNKRSFKVKFPTSDFTPEIAYLYHVQGAGSAAKYLGGSQLINRGQSVAANKLFKLSREAYKDEQSERTGTS